MWDRFEAAPCAHLLLLLLLPHPPASAGPPVPPRPFWVTVLGPWTPLGSSPSAKTGGLPGARGRQGREDASRRAQLSPFVKPKRPGQEGRAKVTPRPALPGGVAGFSENHRTFFPFLSSWRRQKGLARARFRTLPLNMPTCSRSSNRRLCGRVEGARGPAEGIRGAFMSTRFV